MKAKKGFAWASILGVVWELFNIVLESIGRADVARETLPERLQFLAGPVLRYIIFAAIILQIQDFFRKRSWWPRLYRKAGVRYQVISYSLAIATGAVAGGSLAAIIWWRESHDLVIAEDSRPTIAASPLGEELNTSPPAVRPKRTGLGLKKMRDLYVQYCELSVRRSQTYEKYMAAMVQRAIHTSSANAIFDYPPNQRQAVEEQARQSVDAESVERDKTSQVDQELAKHLAQIGVTYPSTPELGRLISGAESRPTYAPRQMTAEEVRDGPTALHLYDIEQGDLATKSIRSELIEPMTALQQYLKKQIDKIPAEK